MLQQINLYLRIERKQVQRFSARTVALSMAALAGVLVVISAGAWLGNQSLQSQLVQQQAQQQKLQQDVAALRESLRQLSDVRELDDAIARLDRDMKIKQRIIARLAAMPDEANGGFSSLLTALAQQPVSGMWFTGITFDDGGADVALKGESRSADLLPQYLQQLSDQPVFTGRRFSVLRMQRNAEPANPVLAFELHARADEVTR